MVRSTGTLAPIGGAVTLAGRVRSAQPRRPTSDGEVLGDGGLGVLLGRRLPGARRSGDGVDGPGTRGCLGRCSPGQRPATRPRRPQVRRADGEQRDDIVSSRSVGEARNWNGLQKVDRSPDLGCPTTEDLRHPGAGSSVDAVIGCSLRGRRASHLLDLGIRLGSSASPRTSAPASPPARPRPRRRRRLVGQSSASSVPVAASVDQSAESVSVALGVLGLDVAQRRDRSIVLARLDVGVVVLAAVHVLVGGRSPAASSPALSSAASVVSAGGAGLVTSS